MKETLSSLTAEYSNIQCQVSAATAASDRFKKLLSSMESLLEKRELQLSKYGFKPTKQELPSYPSLQLNPKKSTSEEEVAKKVDVILKKVSGFSHQGGISASNSVCVGEALVAKYTPAKRKFTATPVDSGDKTYVISQSQGGVEENQSEGMSGVNNKSGGSVEERFAKYINKSGQRDIAVEREAPSSESTQSIAKRMERYSIMPNAKQNAASFVVPSQPIDVQVRQVKPIGSLLSKYDTKTCELTSVQKSVQVSEVESSSPPSASPAPYTPPAVPQRGFTNVSAAKDESFSVGLVPNHLQHSMAFEDDELERTVNLPQISSYRKAALTQPMSVVSTPDVLQRAEGKIPVSTVQGERTPNLRNLSTDLFSKSESKTPEVKQIPSINLDKECDRKVTDDSVGNENVDSNCGVPSVSSVSSIVSKYTKKYNFS